VTGLPGKREWTAGGMLRGMFAVQCGLALLVVATDFATGLPAITAPSNAPTFEVPVAPGDHVRRFDPQRLFTDQPAEPAVPLDDSVPPQLTFDTVTVGERENVLLLTGGIAEGDARRFAAELDAMQTPPTAIALHSPGGLVDEALAIGRTIRSAELPVIVFAGASCLSACPYILAGGTEREVSVIGSVGVHQHYYGKNAYLPAFLAVSDVQAGQAEVMAHLNDMGIDPMLMAKALMTPPDDIYILMPQELTDFRLATTLMDTQN
jgi:hypothetical protein